MEHNSEVTANIAALVRSSYPALRFCAWSTRILEDVLPHPLPSYFEVLEVERKYKEEVFRLLAGLLAAPGAASAPCAVSEPARGESSTLQPGKAQYCIREEDFKRLRASLPALWPIVLVKTLISEAPLSESSGLPAPTPEKLIVDICCDHGHFGFIGDNSLEDVLLRFCDRYHLDQRTLGRYAARRGRRVSLMQYLSAISGKQFV